MAKKGVWEKGNGSVTDLKTRFPHLERSLSISIVLSNRQTVYLFTQCLHKIIHLILSSTKCSKVSISWNMAEGFEGTVKD